MKNLVWPPPLYSFLGYITTVVDDPSLGRKVLDCGAGGKQPPLVLFAQHGFETYGIDISEEQIKRAQAFCKEQGIELDIRKADMRNIPFDDEFFDFVYEFFSMSHMIKIEIAQTIHEMIRVLKKGGYCFLGFILYDTWPLAGRERKKGSGEFRGEEEGEKVVHSIFTEGETVRYLTGLEIIQREKWTLSQPERLAKVSWEDWLGHWDIGDYPEEEKRERYEQRTKRAQYSHIFYIVKKSGS